MQVRLRWRLADAGFSEPPPGWHLSGTSSSHSPHAHRPDGHREVHPDIHANHHSQLYPSGLQCKHQGVTGGLGSQVHRHEPWGLSGDVVLADLAHPGDHSLILGSFPSLCSEYLS